jgi:8-oxo-dGTP pyrophosphatase MutT (NUDIX family)
MQVGGHCEPGDRSLAAAAVREATEESGISGLELDPSRSTCTSIRSGADRATAPQPARRITTTCVSWPSHRPARSKRVSAESHALGWFSPEALPAPMADGVVPMFAPAFARLTQM